MFIFKSVEVKVIFGQEKAQGNGTAIEMFSIIIADNDTSNADGVIDFVYMGDNTKIIHDSLLVSLLIKRRYYFKNRLFYKPSGKKAIPYYKKNMYYTFVDNVFLQFRAGYTQKNMQHLITMFEF